MQQFMGGLTDKEGSVSLFYERTLVKSNINNMSANLTLYCTNHTVDAYQKNKDRFNCCCLGLLFCE